jgi:FixJ family two-component response regulator
MKRAAGTDKKASKTHIAVVDDDALVREALCDCESAGYPVDGFASAEEFLASNSRQTSVCLILDIQLPGVTSLELHRRLGDPVRCQDLVNAVKAASPR